MRKYEFYQKENVISTQADLQEKKQAAVAKKAQREAEILADGSSKIYITEEEELLARLKLVSQVDESDIHFFTEEEIEKIKDVIKNGYRLPVKSRSGNIVNSALYHPKQGEYFLFMMYAGIRGGEAVSLKYSDVSFEDETITICRNEVNVKNRDKDGKPTGTRSRKHGSPKTKSSKQTIIVSTDAIDILRAMQEKEPVGYNGYIIHNGQHQALAEKALWQRFNKLLRGAGVTGCGLHSLRHTCATLLYALSGGDAKFVSEHLRHNDPGFTAKTYVHQSPKRSKELLKKFHI